MEEKKNICEEHTFNKFYETYAQPLRNFIFFKSGNKDESYDVTQEAFIKLWQNCAKVTPEKAKSFLYTVANNLFLNRVAHQKVVFKYAKGYVSHNETQTPQFLLEEKQFGEKLERALSNLTEIQRTAFLMSRVEGKKYREIAAILNISEKAAGKRIHDALEVLRATIEEI